MEEYLELMSEAGIVAYIIIGVVVVGLITASIFGVLRARRKVSKPELPQEIRREEKKETSEKTKVESELGTGQFKCMCFRKVGNIKVLDFTTMPKPVGEGYEYETSCPFSGTGYIVVEKDNKIADYDPRQVGFKFMESPQVAWLARHWPIVKDVFSVPLLWWKSPSTWFAVGMMMIVFISGLVVFD